ncbi:MAG TPA: bifunctional phosphopantothenoylcysteine decarboxylase/phosphopantothenate--cysteine ligase CoaBC, partial [Clostridia bacterium]|nr:bifunctional phosphopantothenoylcysteine decarboxylase/phosphopantothenate--cysteine ligase CoaBC [Clostridia bacterium]
KLIPLSDLSGKKILITAGPTREAIDPVRYITNHSSGKMGYAIAKMAKQRGAGVKIISGPVNIKRPDNIEIIDVNTADEMYKSVMDNYEGYDILIMVAAVADYKCINIADKKIKKKEDKMNLELVKNPDIARELGKVKGDRILVGFSAETNELITNAKAKLEAKNLDMIVANDVTMQGAGFGTDTNIVKLIKKDGSIKNLPMMSKDNVADEILNEVIKLI